MVFEPRGRKSEQARRGQATGQQPPEVPPAAATDTHALHGRSDRPAPDATTPPEGPGQAEPAIGEAASSAKVRPEAVARARRLLEAGKLGSDPDALADRIIDSLLETRNRHT
jgi:hypothetical protein